MLFCRKVTNNKVSQKATKQQNTKQNDLFKRQNTTQKQKGKIITK